MRVWAQHIMQPCTFLHDVNSEVFLLFFFGWAPPAETLSVGRRRTVPGADRGSRASFPRT